MVMIIFIWRLHKAIREKITNSKQRIAIEFILAERLSSEKGTRFPFKSSGCHLYT